MSTDTETGPILVCLDGSPDADAAAALALDFARTFNSSIVAAHVYDARIHKSRFRQMEPGLPRQYQAEEGLKTLRDSHGSLMSDGFKALSRGYLEGFLSMAREARVDVQTVVEEGRNYAGLIAIARRVNPRLTVLGAAGMGDTGDGMLGSTAVRLMRALSNDLIIGRASSPASGPVLAGIDGSEYALKALQTALVSAGMMNSPLHLLAAYDPELHQRVFNAMADTMPPEAQAAVGLDKQQDLHESLIDDGLGALYRTFLDEAALKATGKGFDPVTHLVSDKGYRGIISKAKAVNARLICLGRFGHNREDESDIGANAETVVRLASCHVYLSAPNTAGPGTGELDREDIPWEPEALARLERIPRFIRKTARRSIEKVALEEGAECVTVQHLERVAERFRPKRGS